MLLFDRSLSKRFQRKLLFALSFILPVSLTGLASAGTAVTGLTMPPGFSLSVFADVPHARSLAFAPELNIIFVGTRADTVYAVPLKDDDGLHPTYPVLRNLKSPNGIAWKDGYLYIAEQHRLTRYHVPSIDALTDAKPEILSTALPDKAWHGNRYATFGTDGALYVGVGAACNVCSLHGLEGSIVKFGPTDWARPQIVATGVRNTVGLDVHPISGQIFFTDNGADGMGDDSPPDELNALNTSGAHYGFPWYGGGTDRTPQFRTLPAPQDTVPPQIKFQAHVAPLGIDFYSGNQFPAEYQNDAFVAQHGSWNRSSPVGYRIVRVRFNGANQAVSSEPFVEGWLRSNGAVTGRPVDLEELPDGSLLISDDAANVVYRLTYKKP